MMRVNKWTLGLAAVGLVTLPTVMQGEEKMSSVQTLLSGTTISGYVDTSAHWTVGSGGSTPTSQNAPSFAFNTPSKQDGFNLNVVNVVIEKPLDPQDNWAAGFKIDTVYGPNAVGYNTSLGGSTRTGGSAATGNSSASDFGIKQAYVALRAPVGNGLDFKMGTFDTVIGYEVFNAGNNPNYTRSWGYTIEPTQHTGLLAAYQFCKEFGIAGGVADTVNAGINNRSMRAETDKTYLGSIALSAPESMGALAGSTLYGGAVKGFDTSAEDSRANYYAGLTLNTPLKQLKVGAAYDYASTMGWSSSLNQHQGKSLYASAIGLYASYQATEKLSLHVRGENSRASDLELYAPASGDHQSAASIYSVTGTIQYDLWANVLSRLEFRWDHSEHGTPFYTSAGATDAHPRANAFLLAANIIYKF